MSRIRKILVAAGSLVLLLVIVAVFLPSEGRVASQASVDAPAATVFALINDFRRRRAWSPQLGGRNRLEFAGPASGVGATVLWGGGAGSETIVESVPFERVVSQIESGDDKLRSSFLLEEAGAHTMVRWIVEAEFGIDLAARYRGLLGDRLEGPGYMAELAALREMAERLPRADFSDLEIERLRIEPQQIAWLRTRSLPNAAAISEAMGGAYFEILGFIDRQGLREAGPPLAISRSFSGGQIVFDAAIPVSGEIADPPVGENGVQLGITYGGAVVRAVHRGTYATLGQTHEKIAAWLAAHGVERNGDAWESYVSDPARTPEAELVTHVYYPVSDDDAANKNGSGER
jgi:effector-binding domain-containing protein